MCIYLHERQYLFISFVYIPRNDIAWVQNSSIIKLFFFFFLGMSILLFILNIHIYISIINCSLFFTYHRHIVSPCFWFTFPWLTIDAEKLFMHVLAIWILSLKKKVYLSYFFWENSIKTCILSSVEQITSLGWMHETSTQGWCTGMIQRDGMGTEVGGGIRMGSTCKSMADSCQWMAKTTTIL